MRDAPCGLLLWLAVRGDRPALAELQRRYNGALTEYLFKILSGNLRRTYAALQDVWAHIGHTEHMGKLFDPLNADSQRVRYHLYVLAGHFAAREKR